MKLLCADIGGTNARVAIVENQKVEVIHVYPTQALEGARDLFKRFLNDLQIPLPRMAALAAAGVMEKGKIKGTNIPWDIDCNEISEELGLEKCIVLNDFEAAAWGLLAVDEDKLIKVQGAKIDPLGTKAILGPGTGLGEAILVRCKDGWQVLRTEGGHASLSPRDETGILLLAHLMKKYGHVSFERVLSGSGLVEIYRFFVREDKRALERLSSIPLKERASHVSKLAQNGDEDALNAVEFFFKTYGEEASNLALKCLPSGGIYLTGGITLHLMDFLLKGPFRACFQDKGRMANLLKDMAVFAVDEPLLGILGAAYRLTKGLTE